MKSIQSLMCKGIQVVAGGWFLMSPATYACGGLFCQLVAIEQAGEQIVFRQDGDQITAMVQIQYVGDAEDFGWVVPVPSSPQFDVGSDVIFNDLELATRPTFSLRSVGAECSQTQPELVDNTTVIGGIGTDAGTAADVLIEENIQIGPYDAQVISSDDATLLSQWLADNNYPLSDRGVQLLQPYVEAGMKFVALKLSSDRSSGHIKPIILRYRSDKPVVPIRLTAVAAVEEMGVLIWLVGDARAVPENYLHVTPNYTRLNWFAGSRNAYASYLELVTEAVNEVENGHGFATDFAGIPDGLDEQLMSPNAMEDRLAELLRRSDPEYLSVVQDEFADPLVSAAIIEHLPLPEGQTAASYFSAEALAINYTAQELRDARLAVETVIRDEIIPALRSAYNLLDDNRYLTRLYTTLSAAEMTVDPAFVFNADMLEQAQAREALLNVDCIDDQTQWSLTLGAGTGREGQRVINSVGDPPRIEAAVGQEASWKVEVTSASGPPTIRKVRDFPVAILNDQDKANGGLGGLSSSIIFSGLAAFGIGLWRRRAGQTKFLQ